MPAQIDDQLKQDILLKTNIVDVIGDFLRLKKSGENYFANCPFHNESTPSFSVNQRLQIFNCFGCGKKGDAIQFIIEYKRASFVEAVKYLASRLGIEIKETTHYNENYSALYSCTHLANIIFQTNLRTDKNQKAIEYCKSRKISGETAKKYCIGYAKDSWDNLKSTLLNSKIKEETIKECGLIKEKDSRTYDRLRNRLIFPIRNTKGQVIGFGGRTLDDSIKPKYLNSPETKLFNKSRVLYGIYEAKQQPIEHLILVEGYTDVISLSQAGINGCVATLGTAITKEQVKEALRYSKKLIFCLDGDNAGKIAAWKGLQTCLPFMEDGIMIKFLFIPDNLDPDNYIKKFGVDKFKESIKKSIPLSEFILRHISESIENIDSIDGKAALISTIKPMINLLPDGTFKQMLISKLEMITGIDAYALKLEKNSNYIQRPLPKKKKAIIISPAIRVLSGILKYRELINLLDGCTLFEKIDIMGSNLLVIATNLLTDNPNYTIEHLKDKIPYELHHELSLAIEQANKVKLSKSEIEIDILDALKKMKLYCYDKELEELFLQSKISKSDDIIKRISQLANERDQLKRAD